MDRNSEHPFGIDRYTVKLDIFEGPLDLLLYLVKKNEYDIFDIPIARITEQYMEHLELMRVLNLDIAGEYLVMAATLAHIKSRMLLPVPEPEDGEGDEGDDPRMELAMRLLEYQRFKDAAQTLSTFDILMRDVFLRGAEAERDSGEEVLEDLSIYELVMAFRKILMEAPKDSLHEIIVDEMSLQEHIDDMERIIAAKREVVFHDLFPRGADRGMVVLTFLALLELIRNMRVRIYQADTFGVIRIYWREDS
ncbi:MAG: segregation/condensation protein A [Deltaproteobacteria bacterium]|nr:segregation/condensation protein A [Candidatus Zymogenaceae bacterium]